MSEIKSSGKNPSGFAQIPGKPTSTFRTLNCFPKLGARPMPTTKNTNNIYSGMHLSPK